MDEEKRNQFVDDLLEASLSRYSNVTPREGLQGRVLAHSRATEERRTRFVWLGWLIAGAAAAMIAVGIVNFAHKRTNPTPLEPAESNINARVPEKVPGPAVGENERANISDRTSFHPVTRSVSKRVEDDPRLEVFPSPPRETTEEKLMVQYVRATPVSVLAATPVDQVEIPALEMKELEIPPLVSEVDETKND